ncbi:MAG: flagellar motor protein MotB [Oscillospiraceae bacterium]|jgi:chemotaxis protein MotB|nr:flagellar motor protein MotB [Oscillospiraceae bacterium]
MARKKKPEEATNTDAWLTTYADMISLMLCFFVLMYIISTPDEKKWQWVVQALSNSGEYINTVVDEDTEKDPTDSEGNVNNPPFDVSDDGTIPGVPGRLPMTFDQLFNWVSNAVTSENLTSSVSVSESAGRIYIRFDSDVMFEPDKWELTPEGVRILNTFYPGIRAVQSYIKTVEVSGHTAAVVSSRIDDWQISAMRATRVTEFLDYWRNMVPHDKFKVVGNAENEPYYPNDTEEGRAKNRRVELVIIRNDYQPDETAILSDVLKYDYNLTPYPGGPDDSRNPEPGDFDRDDSIYQSIVGKYNNDEDDSATATAPPSGGDFGPSIPGDDVITPDMLDPDKTATGTPDSSGEPAASDAPSDSGGQT